MKASQTFLQKTYSEQRTSQQNRAMHLLFTQIAEELNNRGIEQKTVVKILEKYSTVPWNSTTVKELIWRTLQKSLLLKRSTTELTKEDVDQVFDVLNREIFVPFGIELKFPSSEFWKE
mgnify:CR=1 FL=1